MPVIINDTQGYSEIILNPNCNSEKFYEAVRVLEKDFGVVFNTKLSSPETYYWDFEYTEASLTLHYNIFAGLILLLKNREKATPKENTIVKKLGVELFYKLG